MWNWLTALTEVTCWRSMTRLILCQSKLQTLVYPLIWYDSQFCLFEHRAFAVVIVYTARNGHSQSISSQGIKPKAVYIKDNATWSRYQSYTGKTAGQGRLKHALSYASIVGVQRREPRYLVFTLYYSVFTQATRIYASKQNTYTNRQPRWIFPT